jgi:hypothetical protein
MEYTLEDKYRLIRAKALEQTSKNPIEIAKAIMHEDYVDINGPEHHFLDGAAFLVAYKNAGGQIDLPKALDTLAERAKKMPGAMCGFWGMCGSTASVGAALAIINKTSPLSNNEYYKDNMEYTSSVIKKMSEIGGPRCCKRNAFLSISSGVEFTNRKYGTKMELSKIKCEFSKFNKECIGIRCPFNSQNN